MFDKRLRNLREVKGYNQEKLAKLLGLSSSTIGMYEQKRRQPDNETLVKIAEIFDVSTDYLLGKSEVKNIAKPYSDELEKTLYNKTKELSIEEKTAILNIINLFGKHEKEAKK